MSHVPSTFILGWRKATSSSAIISPLQDNGLSQALTPLSEVSVPHCPPPKLFSLLLRLLLQYLNCFSVALCQLTSNYRYDKASPNKFLLSNRRKNIFNFNLFPYPSWSPHISSCNSVLFSLILFVYFPNFLVILLDALFLNHANARRIHCLYYLSHHRDRQFVADDNGFQKTLSVILIQFLISLIYLLIYWLFIYLSIVTFFGGGERAGVALLFVLSICSDLLPPVSYSPPCLLVSFMLIFRSTFLICLLSSRNILWRLPQQDYGEAVASGPSLTASLNEIFLSLPSGGRLPAYSLEPHSTWMAQVKTIIINNYTLITLSRRRKSPVWNLMRI